jgi:malate/lactate dehydrogenase
MAVPSDGSYGAPEGVIFSFPCICPGDGTYQIVQGLKLDPDIQAGIKATGEELLAERAVVADLLG